MLTAAQVHPNKSELVRLWRREIKRQPQSPGRDSRIFCSKRNKGTRVLDVTGNQGEDVLTKVLPERSCSFFPETMSRRSFPGLATTPQNCHRAEGVRRPEHSRCINTPRFAPSVHCFPVTTEPLYPLFHHQLITANKAHCVSARPLFFPEDKSAVPTFSEY